MLIPMKHCVLSLPSDSSKEFYIVSYELSSNTLFLLGDKSGLFNEDIYPKKFARIVDMGADYDKIVSGDLIRGERLTNFIVYGKLQKDYSWHNTNGNEDEYLLYTVYCEDWDIYGEFNTRNSFRSIFNRKYLCIYDYRWFDEFRHKWVGYFN
jgi:hypothetical protein